MHYKIIKLATVTQPTGHSIVISLILGIVYS